jgi:secreted Zn-dependent insulinase-like peptidase
MQMSGLAMGNLDEMSADTSFGKVMKRMLSWPGANVKPAAGEQVRIMSPVVKPSRPVEVRRLTRRAGDTNDATVVSFLVGLRTVESRVVFGILNGILYQIAFAELRTKRQLGYRVNAGISPMSNVDYVSIVVQGDQLKADMVEGAVEYVYNVAFPEALANMTHDEFSAHKKSFETMLLEPPAKSDDEYQHFWGPLKEGTGDCFGLASEMLSYLRSDVTGKEVLIEAWNKIAYPTAGRTKLVVKHFAEKVPPRPSKKAAIEIWREQGVPESAFERLSKEYDETVVFDKVDSGIRLQIARNSTFYPPTSICKRGGDNGHNVSLVGGRVQHVHNGRMLRESKTFLAADG